MESPIKTQIKKQIQLISNEIEEIKKDITNTNKSSNILELNNLKFEKTSMLFQLNRELQEIDNTVFPILDGQVTFNL